jgi:hypothetical protein
VTKKLERLLLDTGPFLFARIFAADTSIVSQCLENDFAIHDFAKNNRWSEPPCRKRAPNRNLTRFIFLPNKATLTLRSLKRIYLCSGYP